MNNPCAGCHCEIGLTARELVHGRAHYCAPCGFDLMRAAVDQYCVCGSVAGTAGVINPGSLVMNIAFTCEDCASVFA